MFVWKTTTPGQHPCPLKAELADVVSNEGRMLVNGTDAIGNGRTKLRMEARMLCHGIRRAYPLASAVSGDFYSAFRR